MIFDATNPMHQMVMQHLLGPGGTQQGPLGPGGTQQPQTMNFNHLLGPGGTQQQPQSPYSQTDSYPTAPPQPAQTMNMQHLLGPGGTQQGPLGPGGTYQPQYMNFNHLIGPGGTQQPQQMNFNHLLGPGGTQNPMYNYPQTDFLNFLTRLFNPYSLNSNTQENLPMNMDNQNMFSKLILG